MSQVQNGIATGAVEKMNWVIMIVSVNFLFEGEKIVKKIMKANAVSVIGSDDVAKGMRGAGGKVLGAGGGIKGLFGKKKD